MNEDIEQLKTTVIELINIVEILMQNVQLIPWASEEALVKCDERLDHVKILKQKLISPEPPL